MLMPCPSRHSAEYSRAASRALAETRAFAETAADPHHLLSLGADAAHRLSHAAHHSAANIAHRHSALLNASLLHGARAHGAGTLGAAALGAGAHSAGAHGLELAAEMAPRWPVTVFLLGTMFCMGASAFCHTFYCVSQILSKFIWRFDYAGALITSRAIRARARARDRPQAH